MLGGPFLPETYIKPSFHSTPPPLRHDADRHHALPPSSTSSSSSPTSFGGSSICSLLRAAAPRPACGDTAPPQAVPAERMQQRHDDFKSFRAAHNTVCLRQDFTPKASTMAGKGKEVASKAQKMASARMLTPCNTICSCEMHALYMRTPFESFNFCHFRNI